MEMTGPVAFYCKECHKPFIYGYLKDGRFEKDPEDKVVCVDDEWVHERCNVAS